MLVDVALAGDLGDGAVLVEHECGRVLTELARVAASPLLRRELLARGWCRRLGHPFLLEDVSPWRGKANAVFPPVLSIDLSTGAGSLRTLTRP